MIEKHTIITDLKPIDYNPFKSGYEIEKTVSMNEPQRLMWLSCIIGGDEANLAYNESISLDLKGAFKKEFFKDAIKEVVLRHEALRSVVSSNGESIIIFNNIPFEISYQDFSSFDDQAARIKAFISAEMQNVFDLQEGPLIRAFIHKLNDTHHYFTIVGHHMFCDGWSFGIIMENIAKLYNAKISGQIIKLENADQISEYAVEMAEFKNSKEHEEVKAYWLNLYKDGAPILDFPTDYPRPQNRNFKSNRFDHQIPNELVEKLKKLGSTYGASLVNTLLSAFEVFIFLKTNQTDLIIGMPTAGQAATEKYELVGHCVNLLALRSAVDLETSFNTYLTKRKKDFFDAYENQKFTVGELVESLDQKKDYSRIPILPIIFNVDMGFDAAVSFTDLEYELISNPKFFETFEIFLNATGSKSAFFLEWSYSTQLFKEDTIKQISKDFQRLLELITIDPSVSFKELAAENSIYWSEQLLKWNNTATEYSKEKSLNFHLECSAKKCGFNTAVSYGSKKLIYNDLTKQAEKLSKHLIKKGVNVGDVIAIAMQPSPELAIAILGILKAGAAFLVLNAENPRLRNAYILADSEVKIILVAENKNAQHYDNAVEISLESILNSNEVELHPIDFPNVNGQHNAFVQYESHISGQPVAVKIKHQSLSNVITSLKNNPGIRENDKLLSIATNVSEFVILELLVSLNSGAQIVFANLDHVASMQDISNIIQKENIDILSGHSLFWKKLIQHHWDVKAGLRIWHFGESLTKEIADQLLTRGNKLWSLRGQTETTFVTTVREIVKEDEGINLGWPINNTRILICDEDGKPTPHGKTGEIFVNGDGIAENCLTWNEGRVFQLQIDGQPDQTFHKISEFGRFSDNGDLQYFGRTDQQVKINGIRVEPAEISIVLAKQKNIKESVIIPKEDKQGEIHLFAYVTLMDVLEDHQALIDHWKRAIRLELPEIMVPESFIILDEFTLTANNEIDRLVLPKPKIKDSENDNVNQLQLENELWVAAIWSEILGLKEIDRLDNFFESGGNSMLAVKMMSEIEKIIGVRLPLAVLLKNATVAQLTERILSADEDELWKSIVPLKTSGCKTPIYLIHGAGLNVLLFNSLTKHFDAEQPVYAIQAYGLNGEKEIPATIEEIARKHIAEIFDKDQTGPFAIAGYSLGGYIAFEMAKQLKDLGKEVCFLGLIDSYGYNKHRIDSDPFKLLKKLKRQFCKLPYLSKSFINNPREAMGHQVTAFKNKLNFFVSPEKIVKQFVASSQESVVYKTYANAYESYVLKKIDMKINLFSVEKRLYYLDDRKYLGWKDLTTEPLNIHNVPGDHNTFLHAPNDIRFAEILQSSLDQVTHLNKTLS